MTIDFRLFKTVRIENHLHLKVKQAQEIHQEKVSVPLSTDSFVAHLIDLGLERLREVHEAVS